MPSTQPRRALRVMIAGGGVAALEALIALHDLAGDRVSPTLLTPDEAFTYRPLATARPFSLGRPTQHPLDAIAAEFGAELVHDRLAEVLPAERAVRTAGGDLLSYDALLVAVGARTRSLPHALTFGEDPTDELLHGLLTDLEQGYARHIAFVIPPTVGWALPLYEIALLTASAAWDAGIECRFSLVTPEERPLGLFGPAASEEVAGLLADAGIDFIGSARAELGHNTVRLGAGGRALDSVAIVGLPLLEGPALPGLPADPAGFLPTDPFGVVAGVADVYAAGDATAFPIKQGGLAAQQADAAAESLAARAGAPVTPVPFRPVLRGKLLTGDGSRFLRHAVSGGGGAGEAADRALWWPPTKIAGRYLAPYLFEREEEELLGLPHVEHLPVEVPLEPPTVHTTGEPGIELLRAGRPHSGA